MINRNTTIKITKETKKRLDNLKEYKRESYEEIIQKVLNILNICRINPEKARNILLKIDKDKKEKQALTTAKEQQYF